MKIKCLSFLLIVVTLNLSAQNTTTTPRFARVIELSGKPYERGVQYGTALKTEIAGVLQKWKDNLKSTGNHPDSIVAQFIRNTNFKPAIEKYTPDLMEEVKGIAEGSGQPLDLIYAFQLGDELWIYLDNQMHHCSGLGVAKNGNTPAHIAQNMDIESFNDGYQVVLHIQGDKKTPEQYVLAIAGQLGLNGINENSIAVCVNTLMQLKASTTGLPVTFMIRGILSNKNEKSALNFVQKTPHASGQNYIVGIKDKVYDFEAASEKVVRFIPASGEEIVFHTNHPMANDAIKPFYAEQMKKMDPEKAKKGDSEVRLNSVQTRLVGFSTDITDTRIKEILTSKDNPYSPVCRPVQKNGARVHTFASTIYTLSNEPSMQISMGPPDVNPYMTLTFKKH